MKTENEKPEGNATRLGDGKYQYRGYVLVKESDGTWAFSPEHGSSSTLTMFGFKKKREAMLIIDDSVSDVYNPKNRVPKSMASGYRHRQAKKK